MISIIIFLTRKKT